MDLSSAAKDCINYIATNHPSYEDTTLLFLSFRLLIADQNEAINSLEFNPHMNETIYEKVRVINIGKHKVILGENAMNEEKELDGTENGILYCESIEEDKPKKGYYYLLGSPWPFMDSKVSIIRKAIVRSGELSPSEALSPRPHRRRRHSMGGG